jgi:hypothetical protein
MRSKQSDRGDSEGPQLGTTLTQQSEADGGAPKKCIFTQNNIGPGAYKHRQETRSRADA